MRRTKEKMRNGSTDVTREVVDIGYITTPLKDISFAKKIFNEHKVMMVRCRSDDGWYTLIPPSDTTSKTIGKIEGRSVLEIRLPDEYVFYYIPPLFQHAHSRGKEYIRFPEILFEYSVIDTRDEERDAPTTPSRGM